MASLRKRIGSKIRFIRKERGLTQQNLADLSNLDDAYIGGVERGERNFSIDTLEKILGGLKIELDDLGPLSDNYKDVNNIKKQAIIQFIALTSTLTDEQIAIIQNINKELSKAFE